jgi:hypothetical protein
MSATNGPKRSNPYQRNKHEFQIGTIIHRIEGRQNKNNENYFMYMKNGVIKVNFICFGK